jgi:PHP family Zn ribbon phosphoesterase
MNLRCVPCEVEFDSTLLDNPELLRDCPYCGEPIDRGNPMNETNAQMLRRVEEMVDYAWLHPGERPALRYVLESRAGLLAIARRVAEHFADTDATLGIDARAAIAKAIP